MLQWNQLENEIGKALVNKGIKDAQATKGDVLTCVNKIWTQVYGKKHPYISSSQFKGIQPVDWNGIFETLY